MRIATKIFFIIILLLPTISVACGFNIHYTYHVNGYSVTMTGTYTGNLTHYKWDIQPENSTTSTTGWQPFEGDLNHSFYSSKGIYLVTLWGRNNNSLEHHDKKTITIVKSRPYVPEEKPDPQPVHPEQSYLRPGQPTIEDIEVMGYRFHPLVVFMPFILAIVILVAIIKNRKNRKGR